MKKSILTISVLLGLASFGLSQAKDNVARECVLFELFTGVRCQYCPGAANGVAQMLDEGLAIAPVAYHTSAFSTNLYYTNETNARASYYGISSYPTLKADGVTGVSGGGSASENMYSYYINYYNQRINVASPFTIDLSYEPVEGNTCRVNCTVTQVGECSGTDVRVFIALTQCNINVTWQGMSGLHHVCRDMIPTQTGTVFTGPSMTVSETFEMNWPKEDCYLTAWVQNYSGGTKEVYQAVRMSTALDLDYDLALKKVDEVVTGSCSGVQTPLFTVKNFGSQTVTSFELCAYDGVEEHIQTWEGSLATGESAVVRMDRFVAAPCESLQLYVKMPNGHQDGFMADNYISVGMSEPETIDGYVKMQIKTDNTPEETEVCVKDMVTGEVIRSFTFELPRHVYTEEFVLPSASCYRISILDSGGDGLGSGALFRFEDSSGHPFLSGGSSAFFVNELAVEVNGDGSYWEVPEQNAPKTEIMPNPSDGTFYLNLGAGVWQVAVYDLAGRLVHQENRFSEGKITLEGCESGMYFLKATDGTEEIVRKLMVY